MARFATSRSRIHLENDTQFQKALRISKIVGFIFGRAFSGALDGGGGGWDCLPGLAIYESFVLGLTRVNERKFLQVMCFLYSRSGFTKILLLLLGANYCTWLWFSLGNDFPRRNLDYLQQGNTYALILQIQKDESHKKGDCYFQR